MTTKEVAKLKVGDTINLQIKLSEHAYQSYLKCKVTNIQTKEAHKDLRYIYVDELKLPLKRFLTEIVDIVS